MIGGGDDDPVFSDVITLMLGIFDSVCSVDLRIKSPIGFEHTIYYPQNFMHTVSDSGHLRHAFFKPLFIYAGNNRVMIDRSDGNHKQYPPWLFSSFLAHAEAAAAITTELEYRMEAKERRQFFS